MLDHLGLGAVQRRLDNCSNASGVETEHQSGNLASNPVPRGVFRWPSSAVAAVHARHVIYVVHDGHDGY